MGKLSSLLKWKKSVVLRDEKGLVIKDDQGNPIIVFMRVIGDKDLEESSSKARFASATKRAALAHEDSEEYVSNVALFNTATREQCLEMTIQGRSANWTAEAMSNVTVPDLPKLEEVARDPDAPTLEELEKFDKLIEETENSYQKSLEEYVQLQETTTRTELVDKTDEELRELAKQQVIIVLSIQAYLDTFIDEKTWRSVYQDDAYVIREFSGIGEFQNLNAHIKEQLREEYRKLESGFDGIKN